MNSDYSSRASSYDASEVPEVPTAKWVEPKVLVRPMPNASDNELYWRESIASGYETDGSHPMHYGIVQKAHRDPSRSAIKSESGE